MLNKKWIAIFILLIAPFAIISCGGGGSSNKAPSVSVTGDNTGTGSGGSGSSAGSGTSQYVEITATDGSFGINGETVSSTSITSISATDENGSSIIYTRDSDGNIYLTPADGTVAGTYTVVIQAGGREYELIINVSSDNITTIVSSISYPLDSSIVLDLEKGILACNGIDSLTVSSTGILGSLTGYSQNSGIISIKAADKNGNDVSAYIDSVTGDLIVKGAGSSSYTIIIETADRIVTVVTNENGQIISVSEKGKALLADLSSGKISVNGIDIVLTSSLNSSYSLASGVAIISATAGGGAISLDVTKIVVNSSNGDIYLVGSPSVPAGPYELVVSVDGKKYIIKIDAQGNVTGIIPGNTLLVLSNGNIVLNEQSSISFASQSGTLSAAVTNLAATSQTGSPVSISLDPATGNIVTADSVSGPVTVAFNYTKSSGDIILYTIIVENSKVISYEALVTNPSLNFDYSTVTNIKIFLNVVDEKTGLPLGQASISLLNGNSDQKWKGFTSDQGVSIFTATVASASETAKVIVIKAGYQTVECAITGIGKLVEFGKRIAMTPLETATIQDSDGDGVADADDEFPNDAKYAKSITGVYTLAFEDSYTYNSTTFSTLDHGKIVGNDADFNDLVVRLTLVEKIDSQNRIRAITVTANPLVSLAGNKNSFGIYVNGIRYVMIKNVKDSLNVDTALNVDCGESGLNRSSVGVMPYDPFMVPNGANLTIEGSKPYINEVHLPSVTSIYDGVKTATSGYIRGYNNGKEANIKMNGFVWALIIPNDWAYPIEGQSIGLAYPGFINWCNSSGISYTDWYLK